MKAMPQLGRFDDSTARLDTISDADLLDSGVADADLPFKRFA
jgi:hypothetical protein